MILRHQKILKYFAIVTINIAFNLSCSSQLKNNEISSLFLYPKNLKIITQEDWGGSKNNALIKRHELQRITLHHGGVEFGNNKDPIEYLKNLQSWSRGEKKWMDIPYHFLIDLKGKIYEGRSLKYPGDTNTSYNPSGHLLICLIGNYETQFVNSDQLNSLINILSFFCKKLKIDPEQIKGHKDYAETACPGKDLYKYLENGYIVKEINDQLKNDNN